MDQQAIHRRGALDKNSDVTPETKAICGKYLNIHYMDYVEALGALGPEQNIWC